MDNFLDRRTQHFPTGSDNARHAIQTKFKLKILMAKKEATCLKNEM